MSNILECYGSTAMDGEKLLTRQTDKGIKHLIFDNEMICYGFIGKTPGDYESIFYDGTNGKLIMEKFME